MEFVGHDVCINGNHPYQPKHSLTKTWPPFKVARDVASFLGFLNFYSIYIPYFEQRVAYLLTLAKFDMDHDITGILKIEHESAKVDMINAIISDPCIARYDFEKRP